MSFERFTRWRPLFHYRTVKRCQSPGRAGGFLGIIIDGAVGKDFESGSLDDAWTIFSLTPDGLAEVTDCETSAAGRFTLLMKSAGSGNFLSPVGFNQSDSLLGRSLLGLSLKELVRVIARAHLTSWLSPTTFASRFPQPTRLPIARSRSIHLASGTIRLSDDSPGASSASPSGRNAPGGAGNLDSDPMFVDADGPDDIAGAADDNLRLMPGSLAIDAG